MDPNASTGRDDDRDTATRPLESSSTSSLLSPPPRHSDEGNSRGQVSRLCTRDADDDDVTLQSVISQSGGRSVLKPRERAGIATSYNLAHEGPSGTLSKKQDSSCAWR